MATFEKQQGGYRVFKKACTIGQMEADHIGSCHKSGTTEPKNSQTLCMLHNRTKGLK